MDYKIGRISAIVNVASVLGFALAMLFGFDAGGYFTSMFIAFSFVPMVCAIAKKGRGDAKVAGGAAMIFAGVYATFILIIYFAQLTTVRLEELTQQATAILDYQAFGLFFNLNLLGYGIMALSTFFVGLTIVDNKPLKFMLVFHGIFFISGIIIPMLGIFGAMEGDGGHFIGTLVLLVWCAYFAPVGVLAFRYLKK